MHALLFESRLVTLILAALAVAVGGWVVWAYAADPAVDGVVERDAALAERFGVRAVPVWVANGRVAVGAQPESVLRAVASR